MGHRRRRKKRIEVFIIFIIGIFIAVSFFYMEGSLNFAQNKNKELGEPNSDDGKTTKTVVIVDGTKVRTRYSKETLTKKYLKFQNSFN